VLSKTGGERSLMSRSLGGLTWVFTGSAASSLIKLGVVAVLARLVTPEQFGVMAAVLVVFSFVELFGEIGVAPALVQKDEVTPEDISTAMILSVSLGLLLGIAIFFSAPPLADAFGSGDLAVPFQAMAVIFPIRAVGIVSSAIMQRDLRFKALSLLDLGSYIIGYAAVSVVLAFLGWGHWALIAGFAAQTALVNLGYLVCARFPFSRRMSWSSLKALLSFGGGLTLAKIGFYIANNVDYFVVSRSLGQEALGFYSRAYYLMQQPTRLIGSVGDKVLFPLFASIKKERERLVQAFYVCTMTAFVVTSIAAAQVYVLASDVVQILLGDQWDAVIVPIQWLVLSLPFRVAWKSAATLIRSYGSTFYLAAWQWSYAAMLLVASVVGVRYGIDGVALAVSVVIVINYFTCFFLLRTMYPVGFLHDLGIILKCGAMGLTSGVLTYFLTNLPGISDSGPVLRLLVGGVIGGTILLLAILFIDRIFPKDGEWIKVRLLKALPFASRLRS
jgi:PST family polysaccharide transporter